MTLLRRRWPRWRKAGEEGKGTYQMGAHHLTDEHYMMCH